MKYRFDLTEKVKKYLNDAIITEIGIGCSNSQVIKIDKNDNVCFLKMSALGVLTKEHERLTWLAGKTKVPQIVLYEVEDNVEYLITKAVEGEMLCSNYYINNWKMGIAILIEAFNEIYNIDIKNCPFNVGLDYKLALVKSNIDNNLLDINAINKDVLEKFKTVENIYKYLLENKVKEEWCFSHGDMSLPNVFATDHKFSGFIDVGECGIADKWFDIAIAVKTIKRNYGEKAVDLFFKQLGIKKNQIKINYYLLLMELYI